MGNSLLADGSVVGELAEDGANLRDGVATEVLGRGIVFSFLDKHVKTAHVKHVLVIHGFDFLGGVDFDKDGQQVIVDLSLMHDVLGDIFEVAVGESKRILSLALRSLGSEPM